MQIWNLIFTIFFFFFFSGFEDVSNFDLRFTSKLISRESDERAEPAVAAACKKDEAIPAEAAVHDDQVLFADFDYISPEMLTEHLEEKIMNLQELRIRGYGSPWVIKNKRHFF